ncbi:restriction endonuclease subunit S [Yersinia sp. LJYL362]|uniref:restriction endonuclease subunit S n=1 Tax=Yersinia sp. LJYL362 TaxID=3402108 RepID=UPI003AB5C583
MSIDSKVPEIRFKGFGGEWQKRGFSDIATRVSTHHQSTCLPCVEYEDIVAGKGRFNKDIHQKKTFKAGLKFEAGDVVFGKLRPYLKNWFLADFGGLAVGDFWVLRADNVASTFLFSLIQTNEFELISNLSAGSKMPRSDWGLVSSSCFFVPKNISESNEIGNYFQKLDTLINQHQQKHDKLSNIKKAMLEKMFPKQGETIPEIRFKGFSGGWKEVTLSSVIDVRSGKDYKHLGKGHIPVYGTGGYMHSVDSALSNDKDAIGIGRKGTIDKPYILRAPFWTVDTLFYAVPFTSFNLDFLFCLFQKVDWKKHDESTGVPSLSKIAINNLPVYTTNELEQTAIGNYFQKLDALINQHQQQIIKLNNIKQACLSKMFI